MENNLEVIKQEIDKEILSLQVITRVNTQEEYSNANNVLSAIKSKAKSLKARKDLIINPMKIAMESVKVLFSPAEDKLKEAEEKTKFAMIDFSNREDERARKEEEEIQKEQDRIAKLAEKGKMKEETADKKIDILEVKKEEIVIQKKTVKSEVGSSTIKIERKVRIVDETKIPRMYLVPDMTKIRFDAIGSKERKPIDIPGVEVYEEKNLSARSMW